jgi:hypothetical protein
MWAVIEGRGGIGSIPPEDLETLVEAIAAAVDATATEGGEVMGVDEGYEGERTLWSGRPQLSVDAINTRYELTTERIRITTGTINKTTDDIELVRVKDTKVGQSLVERGAGVGDITVFTTDPSNPTIVLNNVKDAEAVREQIRAAALDARERHGLRYREEM